jgi:hypothetical protein
MREWGLARHCLDFVRFKISDLLPVKGRRMNALQVNAKCAEQGVESRGNVNGVVFWVRCVVGGRFEKRFGPGGMKIN